MSEEKNGNGKSGENSWGVNVSSLSSQETGTKPDTQPVLHSSAAPKPKKRTGGNPKWKKGQSGNPAGKKKGTKNKLTLYRESVLQKQEKKLLDELPEVLDVVIAKAKEGDMTATKLFLERVMQAKKLADENEEKDQKRDIIINVTGNAKTRLKKGGSELEIDTSNEGVIEDADFEEVG